MCLGVLGPSLGGCRLLANPHLTGVSFKLGSGHTVVSMYFGLGRRWLLDCRPIGDPFGAELDLAETGRVAGALQQ